MIRPTSAPSTERTLLPRPRLARRGQTIGLLDISKPRGDVFLDRLEQRLTELGANVMRVQEADIHQAGSGRSAPRDRHKCDVVIEALAD